MEIFAFCVITFESIKIQIRLALQNGRLNPSFMKDFILSTRIGLELIIKTLVNDDI